MGGTPVLNEDLVNLPNWAVLKLRVEGEDVIGLGNVELLSYRHAYDLGGAVVVRELRFRDRSGRETALRSRRFVSMAHVHQAGIEWILTPVNWSGRVEIVSALDARVSNDGVARYRQLEGRHLQPTLPRTFGPEVIGRSTSCRSEAAETE
jgi:alpha,alpha-trehalase